MIKTDKLDEYVSIKGLINYCSAHQDCDGCGIKELCDVVNGSVGFSGLKVEYELKTEEVKE